MRDRRQLIVIPLAALVAALPLIVHGCSCGHDFTFHLLSWMEAATQISHGGLHPHWTFTPGYNAGEPRFVFYPPLSWYLGATIGLVLMHLPGVNETQAWTAAPILFTWIALTLSGLTLYRTARGFASANAALIAAVLYLANPYMLFTAYERTAYAELLAAAWVPLLLGSMLRERVTIPHTAAPLALLWLTNAPAAVIGTYTLAVLAALRLVRSQDRINLARTTLAGTALGFGIAAFYVLPAASERRYVQIAMATIAGMNVPQNFLFRNTGTTDDQIAHDVVLHTVSLIAVALLAATTVALAAAYWRERRATKAGEGRRPVFPAATLAVLTALILFLLTPPSAPIWRYGPQLTFLQFPWRFLIVVAPVLALAVARAFTSRLLHGPGAPSITVASRWIGARKFAAQAFVPMLALALAFLLTRPAYRLYQQRCYIEDTPATRLAQFHSTRGADPTDEYTPVGADNDALGRANPPYWLADSPDGLPPTAPPGPAQTHIVANVAQAEDLILNLRDYPAWHVTLNGVSAPPHLRRVDGLIAVAIPAGQSTIDIRYSTTPDEAAGDIVSVIAAVALVLIVRGKRLES